MNHILVSWIGQTDLDASKDPEKHGIGPIARAIRDRGFDRAVLLTNYPKGASTAFVTWLRGFGDVDIDLRPVDLSSPMDFADVFNAAVAGVERALSGARGGKVDLSFHLSPGTSVMAAVWILLSKSRYPAATLLQSSREHGVSVLEVPFDISAEFIPDMIRKADERLIELTAGLPAEAPAFDEIVRHSKGMKDVIARARVVAPRSVPVLIEGETGTGKELLAKAIHEASARKHRAFIPVNCGAVPAELLESELFGHRKGAFTGADRDHRGFFEQADGGTLFLDEIGDLPLSAQVKFLRVLQERKIRPVGDPNERDVDVRIVAATHRNLLQMVTEGSFREDLFFRLAVAVLRVPPLRERTGDLPDLIRTYLAAVNKEGEGQPGFRSKRLTASGRNMLLQHTWPGNVRELQNTLQRAALWTPGEKLGADEIRAALLPVTGGGAGEVLNRPLGEGLDLRKLLDDVARHYLRRAMEDSRGNKTKAAELVGLPSYQTLTNWLERLGVGE